MELSDTELLTIVTSMETSSSSSPHAPALFDDGGVGDMELLSVVTSMESSSSPLLSEKDELADDVETAVMTGEMVQLSWQDVHDYFNAPILISDSEDEDSVAFSQPPPLHLSPTTMLTADDVISISSDSGSTLSSDTIEEESSRCGQLANQRLCSAHGSSIGCQFLSPPSQ